nr:RNA-directed DNA polymerase, eukaryota [Tanacetum cinerariifolium]
MNGVYAIKTHIVVGVWSGEYMGHGFTKSMKELDRISTMLEELHSAIVGGASIHKKHFLKLPMKPEVNIEEKLLEPGIILEVENQCDVEVDTTSVEVSVEVPQKTKDSRFLKNLEVKATKFEVIKGSKMCEKYELSTQVNVSFKATADKYQRVKLFEAISASYPSLWSSIIKEVNILKSQGIDFLSHCKIRVGNGRNTNFWKDLWIGDSRLCLMFPRLYALDINKDGSVANKLNNPFGSSLRREVRCGAESSQLSQLLDLLDNVILSNMDDRWVKFIPIKLNIFAWKVSLNRLPIRLNLVRRGVSVAPVSCSICLAGLEDLNHLLFGCNMAFDIARSICMWWNLVWSPFDSYSSWLSWFKDIRMHSNPKMVLEGVFYTAWWSIWLFRNQLLFTESHPKKEVIFDDIVRRSFLWCSSRGNLSFRCDSWLQRPYLIPL